MGRFNYGEYRLMDLDVWGYLRVGKCPCVHHPPEFSRRVVLLVTLELILHYLLNFLGGGGGL